MNLERQSEVFVGRTSPVAHSPLNTAPLKRVLVVAHHISAAIKMLAGADSLSRSQCSRRLTFGTASPVERHLTKSTHGTAVPVMKEMVNSKVGDAQ
jgi:hypothetical protein